MRVHDKVYTLTIVIFIIQPINFIINIFSSLLFQLI